MLWKLVEQVVNFCSGEWLLRRRANGGTIILVRSLLVASVLWFIAVAIRSKLAPNTGWGFSAAAFRAEAKDIMPWFGAIFAGVYAGLYSRFSAQWSYLAEFYNQIMESQVQCPVTETNREAYTKWFLAFIDDAEVLHLARKASFAFVVKSLLDKPGVADMYRAGGQGCETALTELEEDLAKVIERENGPPVRPSESGDA